MPSARRRGAWRASEEGSASSNLVPRMARPCPLCENEQLRPLRVSHVEVGTCPHCHGLWFPGGMGARAGSSSDAGLPRGGAPGPLALPEEGPPDSPGARHVRHLRQRP
ncbi:zf-TFIIB domain-containing protein [Cystobacter fuscus]